jgi:hypothetical protein
MERLLFFELDKYEMRKWIDLVTEALKPSYLGPVQIMCLATVPSGKYDDDCCQDCNGRGWFEDEDVRTECEYCEGGGWVSVPRLTEEQIDVRPWLDAVGEEGIAEFLAHKWFDGEYYGVEDGPLYAWVEKELDDEPVSCLMLRKDVDSYVRYRFPHLLPQTVTEALNPKHAVARVPDVSDLYVYYDEGSLEYDPVTNERTNLRTARVENYLKVVEHDGRKLFMYCPKEEAEYILGYNGSVTINPLASCHYKGPIPWEQKAIDSLRKLQQDYIGRVCHHRPHHFGA